MDPPITTLKAGDRNLKVYWADTPNDWRQGLSGRDLTGVDGMCFAFGRPVQVAFHMQGMTVPILIAFFDGDGGFVDATWLDTDAKAFHPLYPYVYALELVGDHASNAGVMALLPALTAGITVP